MENHLLLEKAYIYPLPKDPSPPSGCQFDHNKGYWIHKDTGQPLVTLKNHPKLTTKKCDVETGEDNKGE
jgi:hypothetical protein